MRCSLIFLFVLGIYLSNTLPTDKKSYAIDREIDELKSLLEERILEENIDNEYRSSESDQEQEVDMASKKEQDENKMAEEYSRDFGKADIDNPQNIDPDNPLENLLEGMAIEVNGVQHRVQGLHPENTSKTKGESHDGHRYVQGQQDGNGNIKRNFITRYLWHKAIIPYEIYGNVSPSTRNLINAAVKDFSDTTCVKWVPRSQMSSYNLNHDNFVRFINEQGCWSYVGNVADLTVNPDSIQEISIQEPYCAVKVIVIHEMLHAAGAHHEQSRSDRDKYVKILFDNIRGGRNNNNMWKSNTDDHNPYDAESALQYSLYSFSSNGQRTIKFHDQRMEFLADSATGLEFYDIQDLTDTYRCTANCVTLPSCQNGGFVNFRCECVCPDSLTGRFCENTVSNSATCGGVVNLAAGEVRYIQSPNYPSNYPTGLECTWLIKGTKNNIVRATVVDMDIAAGAACYHWLEYRYNLLGQKGPKRCGTNHKARVEFWDSTLDELSNAMIIKFDSNKYSNRPGTTGFELKFENIGTGCVNNPCVYGTCTSPEGSTSYKCSCDSGVSGQNCDIISASSTLSCTFEFGEKCFLKNDKNDNFDWDFESGSTPTSRTGPSRAKEGFQYIFIDSYGRGYRRQGHRAVLVNSNIVLQRNKRCLSFYYHMKGFSNLGDLKVYTEGFNQPKTQVFSESGDKGDSWHKADVDIPAIDNLKIYIEAVRGDSRYGDMALDDVVLRPGTCSNGGSGIPVVTVQQGLYIVDLGNSVTISCNVSSSLPITQVYWQKNIGGVTTTITNTNLNKYTGSTITSPSLTIFNIDLTDIGTYTCFASNSIGTGRSINTFLQLNGTSPITSTSFPPITNTQPTQVPPTNQPTGSPIDSTETCTFEPDTSCFMMDSTDDDFNWRLNSLFITANKKKTWKGDIAIDNLRLYPESCDQAVGPCFKITCQNGGSCMDDEPALLGYSCVCSPGFTGFDCELKDLSMKTELFCGFEGKDPCVFDDSSLGDTKMSRKKGPTQSSGTGPSGAFQGLYYKYLEASSPQVDGDRAILSTEKSQLANFTSYCLTFYYHMWGSPGSLSVRVGERYGPNATVWEISGDQGNKWKKQTVQIKDIYYDPEIFVIATRGDYYQGDIAVDSVLLKKGKCYNPCSCSPCLNSGICQEKDDGTFTCVCQKGWTGDICSIPYALKDYKCDFEKGESCIFINSKNDDFDWKKITGPTPSTGTGPSKAYSGAYYLYTEVSNPVKDWDKAVLTSENTKLDGSKYCLRMAYHRRGQPGPLVVRAGERGSKLKEVWRKNGNQGRLWRRISIDIPFYSDPVITIQGGKANTWKGDTAIDKLQLKGGSCT